MRLGRSNISYCQAAVSFVEQGAARVCVNVDVESPGAHEFYTSMAATDLGPYWMEWRNITAAIHPEGELRANEEL